MLRGARFEGADLEHVQGLTQNQLTDACGNAETRLPEGLHLPACPARPEGDELQPKPDADNPCAHELRDDRWPQ